MSTLFNNDEELRVPADRPADADAVAPVRGDLQRQEEAAAAEEVGSVPREEPLLLRRTDHRVAAERRPPSYPRPYCRHLWPFLCIRVSRFHFQFFSHCSAYLLTPISVIMFVIFVLIYMLLMVTKMPLKLPSLTLHF